MTKKEAGVGPGERQLNGPQTTGREYRNLSEPTFAVHRTNNVEIIVRDGTTMMADLFQPDADGQFPALLCFSPYPRQIQDLGAPLAFVEAGVSDFWVPRGYAQVIVNARGTGGSGGTWTVFDHQEREDLYDLVEWMAAQPWCNGQVGMLGISYFAMAQLAAAAAKPPHLKAIAPLLNTADLYDISYHNGLYSSGFISAWLPAVGALADKPDALWRSRGVDLARDVLQIPAIHRRMQYVDSEAMFNVLKGLPSHFAEHPYGDIWRAFAVEHPMRDAFWDDRNTLPLLENVDIPVYLGADWDNVGAHLPSTFTSWKALCNHNPNVRMALLPQHGFSWPWESLHIELLAWYDHWLKGRSTGVMDGDPVRYQVQSAHGWRTATEWPPRGATLTPYTLRADGQLGADAGQPGSRSYLHLPAGSGGPSHPNPRDLPALLTWDSPALETPLEIVGDIELILDATITATDTSWITVLYDVAPDGTAETVTAGWLRATLSTLDQEHSVRGAPVYECRQPVAIPVGAQRTYRIPLVPTAKHLATGHRIRLVLASSDDADRYPTVQKMTHVVVREASLNTVAATSQLWLPVMPI